MPSGSPLQKRQGQGSAALPLGAGVSHHFVTGTVPSNLPLLGLRPKIDSPSPGREGLVESDLTLASGGFYYYGKQPKW